MANDAATDEDGGNEDADAGMMASLRGVTINMTGMGPHVDQRMEFRIVTEGNMLVARGVLDPLPAASTSFSRPNSTPDGAHVDFTADLNGNGSYDAPPHEPVKYAGYGRVGTQNARVSHQGSPPQLLPALAPRRMKY